MGAMEEGGSYSCAHSHPSDPLAAGWGGDRQHLLLCPQPGVKEKAAFGELQGPDSLM